jgi:hypothetical protein
MNTRWLSTRGHKMLHRYFEADIQRYRTKREMISRRDQLPVIRPLCKCHVTRLIIIESATSEDVAERGCPECLLKSKELGLDK